MATIKKNSNFMGLPINIARGNPIPLDNSEIWYSYEEMSTYAKTSPIAYVGQILGLVNEENNSAIAYIIFNKEGDLVELGTGSITSTLDEVLLELENLKESLNILEKLVGSPKTDDSEASGIFAELDQKANINNVYTKEETNHQINEAVLNASHLKRKVISSIDEIDINAQDADQYIYMVPSGLQEDDNKYYEYIVIESKFIDDNNITITTKEIEKVGSWEINLDEYAKLTDLQEETNRAIAAEELLQNNINTLNQDIQNELLNKVDKVYYTIVDNSGNEIQVPGTLLSPIDKKKLDILSIDDNGNLTGKIIASEVANLDSWISNNAHKYITNLTENNFSEELKNKINFITSVNETNFQVINGQLNLLSIKQNQVENLEETLNNKVEKNDFDLLQNKVNNLDQIINGYTDETTQEEIPGLSTLIPILDNRINDLEDQINNLDENYVTVMNFNKVVGNLNDLLAANINIYDEVVTINEEINDINLRLTWQELI